MWVFRDKTGLSATPSLWSGIESALASSEYFILFASPDAAASPWVEKEVAWWLEKRDPHHLLIALTDGDIVWDREADRLDAGSTTALPPSLRVALRREPLWVDLRWARSEEKLSLRHSRFRDAILDLAAPLLGRPKDSLDSEDVRAYRNNRRAAYAAVAISSLLTVGAVFEATQARHEASIATSRAVGTAAILQKDAQPDLASLLAIESGNVEDTFEARNAAMTLYQTNPRLVGIVRHPVAVRSVVFSPADDSMTSIAADGKVRVWDGPTRRLRESFDAPNAPSLLTFSSDGRYLAAGRARAAALWDLNDRERKATPIELPSGEVYGIVFLPMSHLLAVAGNKGEVWVWDPAVGRFQGSPFMVGENGASSLVATADGAHLAVGLFGGSRLRLFNVSDHQIVATSERPMTVSALAADPNAGKLVVATHTGGSMSSWDLATFAFGPGYELPTGSAQAAVTFDPSGRLVASGNSDGTVQVWNALSHKALYTLRGHRGAVTGVAFRRDGAMLASSSLDGTVALWDVREHLDYMVVPWPALVQLGERTGTAIALRFSSDGKRVLMADAQRGARAFDVESGAEQPAEKATAGSRGNTYGVLRGKVQSHVAFSRDGKTLYLTLGDEIQAVDLDRPRVLRTSQEPGKAFMLTLSPDEGLLASLDRDNMVHLWNPGTLAPLGSPMGPVTKPSCLAFAPDNRFLGIASSDGSVDVWDIGSRRHLATLRGGGEESFNELSGQGENLAFSPDAKLIAAGSASGLIRLWEVGTWRPVGEPLQGDEGGAAILAFGPRGDVLATGSGHGVVRLWDVPSRRPLGEPLQRFGGITGLVFSPDGNAVAWLSNGYVLRSVFDPSAWRARACALANRNLSMDEWEHYVGTSRAYHRTCANVSE
jgi:WD40 repeat protein